jgi:hypothetical protein
MIEPSMLASDLRLVIGQLIRRLREERRDLTLSQATVLAIDWGRTRSSAARPAARPWRRIAAAARAGWPTPSSAT